MTAAAPTAAPMPRIDPRLVTMALIIARAYARRLPPNVLLGDLEQAALLGLVDGLRRHPDGEGGRWEHYLRMRIRGEIIDELRRQDWATRRQRSTGGGRSMPAKVLHFDDVDERWDETFANDGDSPETIAIRACDADKAWRTPLSARDTRIMRGCFATGGSGLHEEVADAMGVSPARVSQIVRRSLDGMRSHLTGDDPPIGVPTHVAIALWKRRVG